MLEKEEVKKELDKLIEIRSEFLDFLDEGIPKKGNNIEFDFENNPTLDAKTVYEHFLSLITNREN